MQIYEDLNIYELRALGRKFGVRCPTKLKRDDIISNIKKIKSGELEPFFRTSKQGRPVKGFNEKFADAAVVFVEKEKKILGEKQDYKEFFIFLNSLKGLFRNSINLIDNFLEENKEFFN